MCSCGNIYGRASAVIFLINVLYRIADMPFLIDFNWRIFFGSHDINYTFSHFSSTQKPRGTNCFCRRLDKIYSEMPDNYHLHFVRRPRIVFSVIPWIYSHVYIGSLRCTSFLFSHSRHEAVYFVLYLVSELWILCLFVINLMSGEVFGFTRPWHHRLRGLLQTSHLISCLWGSGDWALGK